MKKVSFLDCPWFPYKKMILLKYVVFVFHNEKETFRSLKTLRMPRSRHTVNNNNMRQRVDMLRRSQLII